MVKIQKVDGPINIFADNVIALEPREISEAHEA